MPEQHIDLQAWLEELEKLQSQSPDGFTSEEAVEALHLSERVVASRIRRAIKAGILEFAGRRRTYRIDGRPSLTPIYRRVNRAG